MGAAGVPGRMSQGARRGSGGPCQSLPTARGDPAVSPLQRPGPEPGCGHLRGTHTLSGSLETLQAGGPLVTQSTHLRKGCVRGLRASDGLHCEAWPVCPVPGGGGHGGSVPWQSCPAGPGRILRCVLGLPHSMWPAGGGFLSSVYFGSLTGEVEVAITPAPRAQT